MNRVCFCKMQTISELLITVPTDQARRTSGQDRIKILFVSLPCPSGRHKSEHRGTSSPQSELGYIVPGSLCAFMDPGRWEEKPVTHSKTMNDYQRPLEDDTPQVLEDHRLDDISAPAIHRYVNILMDKWFKKILGAEANKDALIGILRELIPERQIADIRYDRKKRSRSISTTGRCSIRPSPSKSRSWRKRRARPAGRTTRSTSSRRSMWSASSTSHCTPTPTGSCTATTCASRRAAS